MAIQVTIADLAELIEKFKKLDKERRWNGIYSVHKTPFCKKGTVVVWRDLNTGSLYNAFLTRKKFGESLKVITHSSEKLTEDQVFAAISMFLAHEEKICKASEPMTMFYSFKCIDCDGRVELELNVTAGHPGSYFEPPEGSEWEIDTEPPYECDSCGRKHSVDEAMKLIEEDKQLDQKISNHYADLEADYMDDRD